MQNQEYFKKLARQLMFELTDEEAQQLIEEYQTLSQQFDLLDAIDTEGVAEMVYPFETPTSYLREDKVENVLTQEEAMANVCRSREGHVLVPKVVK